LRKEENGTEKSEVYIKIVGPNFPETNRLASLVAEVTGFIIDSMKSSGNTVVCFLDPAHEPTTD
jgi:hypothetical protein